VGGAVCAPKNFIAALTNYARAFIYSTAIPPWIAVTASEAIDIMHDEPQRQLRVRQLAKEVRERLSKIGLKIPAGDSPIIPIILGEEKAALDGSARLMQARLLVPAIRPPTVAKNSSRLRVTLCCDHTDAEIDQLIATLCK